jgi:hypothetical protein
MVMTLVEATRDRETALDAFDRLTQTMRLHIDEVARPAGNTRQ